MSNLKIELTLDGSNEELVALTGNLMAALSGQSFSAEVKTTETEEPKKKRTTKKSAPKAEAPKAEAPKAEEPKEKEVKTPDEGSVSRDQVKALLATKISDHRTDIKAWMTKAGADKISNIKEEDLQPFFDFLETLD